MGYPSFAASNAVIYVTYGAFLIMGTGIAWKMRNQSKADFLSGNGTQTGQKFPAFEMLSRNDRQGACYVDRVFHEHLTHLIS
jgi:hypothetical protein